MAGTALAQHLDQDYREDEESARAIRDLTNELIELDYVSDGLEAVLTWEDGFTEADIEQRLTRCRETEVFDHLADMKWPLLSSDLAKFRCLASLNVEFAKSISARPNIELPHLCRTPRDFKLGACSRA